MQGLTRTRCSTSSVRYQLKFLDYAPILHISAKTGERTPKLLETIDKVAASRRHARRRRGELNRFIEQITSAHPPVSPGHRNVRVLYAAQTGVAPPTFVLFTNVATKLHFSYERFLENQLREKYGFVGTPIKITVRKRSRGRGGRPKRDEARVIYSADQVVSVRWHRPSANCSSPPTSARWRSCSRTCCGRGRRSFRVWGSPPARGGGRVYRRADVELVLRIKQLVFGEGLTLAGARRRLEEEQQGAAPSVAAVAVDDVLGDMARTQAAAGAHRARGDSAAAESRRECGAARRS